MTTTKDIRCDWAGSDARMLAYHDQEWGVPLHDDRRLFEFLVLEGAQAGLSWQTILNKRDGYRSAFAEFDPARSAACATLITAKLTVAARITVSFIVIPSGDAALAPNQFIQPPSGTS